MVAGQKPFEEDKVSKAISFQLNEHDLDPAEVVPDLPRPLRNFILKASRRDPKQRYQSIDMALAELRPLAQQFGLADKASLSERTRMATLFMICKDYHQPSLNQLMEEFGPRAKELGIDIKMADLKNI